jgi:hypothetical protein
MCMCVCVCVRARVYVRVCLGRDMCQGRKVGAMCVTEGVREESSTNVCVVCVCVCVCMRVCLSGVHLAVFQLAQHHGLEPPNETCIHEHIHSPTRILHTHTHTRAHTHTCILHTHTRAHTHTQFETPPTCQMDYRSCQTTGQGVRLGLLPPGFAVSEEARAAVRKSCVCVYICVCVCVCVSVRVCLCKFDVN